MQINGQGESKIVPKIEIHDKTGKPGSTSQAIQITLQAQEICIALQPKALQGALGKQFHPE